MRAVLSLYIVRHAIAAERGDAYPNDDLRPLTQSGVSKFRKAVKGLAQLDVGLDGILTSPLVRARHTADILAEGLTGPPPVVEVDALRPGASVERLTRAVSDRSDWRTIALVGHEPGIGEVAARFIQASTPLSFNKGAVCRIDFDEWPSNGAGCLRWFVTQKMLRRMAD